MLRCNRMPDAVSPPVRRVTGGRAHGSGAIGGADRAEVQFRKKRAPIWNSNTSVTMVSAAAALMKSGNWKAA